MKKIHVILLLGVSILFISQLGWSQKKELTEKRTYFSKTYLNPDESYTTEISLGFMHYIDNFGEYKEINRNFQPSTVEGYAYEITAGHYHAYVKPDLSQPEAVVFETKGGAGVTSSLIAMAYMDNDKKTYEIIQNIQTAPALISGSDVVYKSAFPGVDVIYRYEDTCLKEEIYFSQDARNSLPPPTDFGMKEKKAYLMFVTQLNSTMPTVAPYAESRTIKNTDYEGIGPIDFKDLKGNSKFTFPVDKAFLENKRDSLEMKYIATIKKRIVNLENGTSLLLTGVPFEWINSIPQGTIVFDPQIEVSITMQPGQEMGKDALLHARDDNPDTEHTNYGTGTTLYIGKWYSGADDKYYRSILEFDFSMIPANATIDEAYLHFYNPGSNHLSTIPATYLQRVTEPWTELGVTWANQPSTTTMNQVSIPAPGSPTADIVNIDVENLVEDILASNNYGFLWKSQNEGVNGRINVASSDYTNDPNKRPKIEIDYTLNEAPAMTTFYIRDAAGNVIATYKR